MAVWRSTLICVLSVSAIVPLISGHSWLACTDYTEKNGDFFDHFKCRGYPRGANQYLSKDTEFGQDSGYDHQPSETHACKFRQNDRVHYDAEYPKAVYYPGQQVVLAHPMKDHGADSRCTNIFIPDTGSWIYRSELNRRVDPSLSEFKQKLVFDLGATPLAENTQESMTYPKPGFQNAPSFCLSTDKSLGTYSFNVPLDLAPGRYTFMWMWAFNNMGDLFSTCFEVEITRNQAERNRKLLANGFTDLSEPCGGWTSNPLVPGVCNRNIGVLDYDDAEEDGPGDGASMIRLDSVLLLVSLVYWILDERLNFQLNTHQH